MKRDCFGRAVKEWAGLSTTNGRDQDLHSLGN